ncbi:MAG: DNA translocase FtsK 4TM domain-containing protein [Bacteroidia bacterium]
MAIKENSFKNEFKAPDKPGKKPISAKTKQISEQQTGQLKKVTGLLMLTFSVFLVLALISFMFSWKTDQSLVAHLDWEMIKKANPEMTQNHMGIFGAWLSHLLVYRWFGLASFIFVPLIFLTGFRLLFDAKNIKLSKIYTLSSISIFFFSLLFGYVSNQFTGLFGKNIDFFGGAMGYQLQLWLSGVLGAIGVALLLGISVLSFFTVMFNLNFTLPTFRKKEEPLLYTDPSENASGIAVSDSTDKKAGHIRTPEKILDEIEELDDDDDEFKLIVLPDKNAPVPTPPAPKPVSVAPVNGVNFQVKQPVPAKAQSIINEAIHMEEIQENKNSWYQFPSLNLLRDHQTTNVPVDPKELEDRKNLIVETLQNYKISIDKIEATIGPTVTLYEIIPSAGVRISKIKSLEDDIALSLSALGIRIIAPMPGKGTIGIEVPNLSPEIVSLKEALASPAFRNSTFDLPIAMGKTISNEVFVADLTKMPHLLMAGATGQGKSVGINTIIASILYKKHPDDVKFVLVDPKKVELSLFKNIEKHFLPELPDGQEAIITDTKMVVDVLKSLCVEMDKRYDKLKDAQVRNIKEYNKKIERGLLDQLEHKKLPYIVLVIDELADLMMTAGKEVELPIARLAQLARAIGIHLIVATQRPSVNIITGVIKANFPSRLAFRVTSRIDSRTILDAGGAEQLIGRGDMLYSTGNDMIRLQCPFIDTDEVEGVTDFIRTQPYPEPFRLNIITDDGGDGDFGDMDSGDWDPLFEDAARLIVNSQQGSTSMLQRRLKLGYNRAGRLMDQLEKAKIVGCNEGSKAREVLIGDEFALEQFLSDMANKTK